MPTTEATGVRLTIHEKYEYPFPDTFGFSAPTVNINLIIFNCQFF
jgi:hypothetical protein